MVLRFCCKRDVLANRLGDVEVRASRTEAAGTRSECQTQCHIFGGNNLFIAYRIAIYVQQLPRGHIRQREVNLPAVARQRVESIGLELRRQHQMCLGITVVVGLGAHQHIAVALRTFCIHVQTCGTILPAAVVFLDLADAAVRETDTDSIDNVDIVAFAIRHADRTVETADGIVVPVVGGCLQGQTVAFVQSGARTTVVNKLEVLRHTEGLAKIQVVRVVDDLIGIRVEIDRIFSGYRNRHQLLADQRRPNLLARLLALMIAERDLVAPSLRRIRKHHVMLISNADTRNLECGRVIGRNHTVELVERLFVLYVRRINTGSRVTRNIPVHAVQIVRRTQFGIFYSSPVIIRPAFRRREQTRPAVVGYDSNRIRERRSLVVEVQT